MTWAMLKRLEWIKKDHAAKVRTVKLLLAMQQRQKVNNGHVITAFTIEYIQRLYVLS